MNARVEPCPALEPTAFVAPALRAEVAALMNLAASRRAIPARLHERPVSLRLRPAREHPGPHAVLCWTLAGEAQHAAIPRALVEALCLPAAGAPAEDAAALLLEAALAETLGALEAALGQPIAFTRFAVETETSGADAALFSLEIEHERTLFAVPLLLRPAALAALPGLLRLLPRRRADPGALPVSLCARVGVTQLDLAALRALRPGDAVLLEETGLLDGRLALVVGERRIAIARLGGGALQVEGPLGPVRGTALERWCMDDTVSDPIEEGIGDLRVTLVFELGRRLASLAEIEGMGPGSVVQTGAAPDGMVDVLASGRRIGRGRIVQVGGALAVQLERINHGAAT